ncbi:MAG TPA: Maf family nucleotide pyrophosphatase [Acetobacteraceae bacterium]|nr:Maf family nucleotide pyrophosphatase [Acetobacteraceae bacterium]
MTWQADEPAIVLASESTARHALLRAAGVRFEATAPRIDEDEIKASASIQDATADETALLLADLKAKTVARRRPDSLVIGADQLLVYGDRWFDKPRDVAEAAEHLRTLRGRAHTLVTAVCCRRAGSMIWHHVAKPVVTMRPFSDAFLTEYLRAEGDAVTATVGCYKIEGRGIQLFERVEGDDSAIRGLPLLPLLAFLRQHGVLSD